MPIARYFLSVGAVLLALLFIADACLPNLPTDKAADTPAPVIHIYSQQKWPERIDFDTTAPIPPVAVATNLAPVKPTPKTAAVVPTGPREALAQLQTANPVRTQVPKPIQVQVTGPKKQEAHRQTKIAKRHFARQPVMMTYQAQYAWLGGHMRW